MSEPKAGGFEYRGRTHRFEVARCHWSPGHLDVEAKGSRCWLKLVGMPFPGVADIADLVGCLWDPDEEQLSLYADTFAEGGFEVRGRELIIQDGRFECRRYDASRCLLTLDFRLSVEDVESGGMHKAEGVVYCLVQSPDEADV